jgi:hypothetical protein
MFVWAVVAVGPSFSLYSNSYVPRGVAVSHLRTFTRSVQPQTSFLLFLFVAYLFFLYIGNFFNVCMIQLYVYTTSIHDRV